ncbi:MAG: hypothetical protein PHC38_10570, partial [Weeksellaceae bacterium]|nr:hypothetical protein [Weeksellaceae bacterium]
SKICNFTGIDSNFSSLFSHSIPVVNCFQKFVILQGLIPTSIQSHCSQGFGTNQSNQKNSLKKHRTVFLLVFFRS